MQPIEKNLTQEIAYSSRFSVQLFVGSIKFTIEDDICACVCASDLSIQIVNSSNSDDDATPFLFVEIPGTFTVIKPEKQQFSLEQLGERVDLLSMETFEIIPIRRGGGDNDDRGGSYGGGRVDVEFGPGGPEWSASVFGGYEDERGNYVEVEVRRNEDGSSSGRAEAGHDKDK